MNYNATTAFGNPELIKVVKEEEAKEKWLKESDPCDRCHERGYVSHDCDCPFCSEDSEECEDCDGLGRIEKEN